MKFTGSDLYSGGTGGSGPIPPKSWDNQNTGAREDWTITEKNDLNTQTVSEAHGESSDDIPTAEPHIEEEKVSSLGPTGAKSLGLPGAKSLNFRILDPKEKLNKEVELQCSVFSPRKVCRGSSFLIQVFAHSIKESQMLVTKAVSADPDSKLRVAESFGAISTGSKVEFTLKIGDIPIEESTLSTTWTGTLKQLQFDAVIPEDYVKSEVIGKILVAIKSVPIGQLKFKISIVASPDVIFNSERKVNTMERFRQAFISYSSKDRFEVLKRVQMLNSSGLSYFQDLITLEAGEKWEKVIYEYLNKSDVIFLMWSKAASESPWVMKEILYALELRKTRHDIPEIIPVPIEGPPMVKPPDVLSFIHFDDKFTYFLKAYESKN